MDISLLLAKQIGSMLIMLLFGFLAVRAHVLKVADGKVLSAGRTLNKKQVKALLEKVL